MAEPDEKPGEDLTTPSVEAVEDAASSSHLSGVAIFLTIFALCMATFCVALDNTIISTAIPHITDEFHALQDVGWYGSAYLLTTCAFQLPFGKLLGIFSPKWTFLAALFVFELGSLICGAAPSSATLIIGRAISGVGSAGVYSGSLVILAHTVPLHKRPVYMSLMGSMFGIAAILGPLLGGAFTYKVTWRWCFYINLPVGAATAVVIIIYLHLKSVPNPFKTQRALKVMWSLDPLGIGLFVPSIICVLIALQWGGVIYPWDGGRIMALFIVSGIALAAFTGIQVWLGEGATIPPRIVIQRTVWAACVFTFCSSSALYLLVYYIPIYFQAVKGMSALQSGIASIPLILSDVVSIIVSGGFVNNTGFYMPPVYVSVALMSIGSGLVTTITPDTSVAKLIGYQILFGLGVGFGLQIPQIAAQSVLPHRDVQTGIAVTLFFMNFGPAILLGVGNNVLDDRLKQYVAALQFPDVDPNTIIDAGATAIRGVVPPGRLDAVVRAYSRALVQTFRVALIMSCLTVIGAGFMEWRSVRNPEKGSDVEVTNQGGAS